jgi:hypothetical protein
MEINNIERNIMYLLAKEWLKSGSSGPFDTDWIFESFSDIPDKNIKEALLLIEKTGYAELASNYRRIAITQKGLSKIRFIKLPQNGKLPLPTEIEKPDEKSC